MTVCTGNICRSPMAEVVLAAHLAEAGVEAQVISRGISDEEHGNPIDRRAAQVLQAAGYEVPRHRAAQVRSAEIGEQDLVLAMTYQHFAALRRLAPGDLAIRMYREFDPSFAGHAPASALDIADPWYGTRADFEDVLQQIEAGIPAIVKNVKEMV